MGDQLWLGLDTGALQQVDLTDPASPQFVGEMNLNEPIIAMSRSIDWLNVATTTHLYAVHCPYMPPTLRPDLVMWSHGGGRSWAGIGFEFEWPATSITWSDGFSVTNTDGCHYCAGVDPTEVPTPPMILAVGDGIPAAPFIPASVTLRGFNIFPDPGYVMNVRETPVEGCVVDRGASDAVHTTVNVLWTADAGFGDPHILYSHVVETDGSRGEITFDAPGPITELLSYNDYLVAVGDGLTVWDTDNARGGDALNPVLKQHVDLFGGDHVVKATHVFWGPLLAAADHPGRFSMLDPNPWYNSLPTPVVQADNVTLPGLTGSVRDLFSLGNELYVLTDGGVAGRIFRYSIEVPTAPVLELQTDVGAGNAAVAIAFRGGDDTVETSDSVLVVRRGWGIDVLSVDLAPITSLRLPGDPQAVFWNWGTYVLLGDFGVAEITGPVNQPVADFVFSNMSNLGRVIHRSNSSLVTPEGQTSW